MYPQSARRPLPVLPGPPECGDAAVQHDQEDDGTNHGDRIGEFRHAQSAIGQIGDAEHAEGRPRRRQVQDDPVLERSLQDQRDVADDIDIGPCYVAEQPVAR